MIQALELKPAIKQFDFIVWLLTNLLNPIRVFYFCIYPQRVHPAKARDPDVSALERR